MSRFAGSPAFMRLVRDVQRHNAEVARGLPHHPVLAGFAMFVSHFAVLGFCMTTGGDFSALWGLPIGLGVLQWTNYWNPPPQSVRRWRDLHGIGHNQELLLPFAESGMESIREVEPKVVAMWEQAYSKDLD
jgi:hypothetical protein